MGQLQLSKDGALAILPIHFDLPTHAIPLNTFIRTAEHAANIVNSLNKEIFNGTLRYEVLVLPAQEGSFKSKLGIYLLGGWLAVWQFLDTDVGKGFIRGLTTQEPAYWADQVGSAIRERLITFDDETAENGADRIPSEEEKKSLVAVKIFIEATKSFLQKDVNELESAGITTARFCDAFVARNEFYEACAESTDIRAIGFEDEPAFPIQRSDFARFYVKLPPVKDEDDEPWMAAIVDIKVTSPNWEREDRQRFWKGRDIKGRERLFRIEDEEFWELVRAERLNIHIMDTIKVQWVYHGKENTPKNIRVLRVLEFNGDVLSEPLDDKFLAARLSGYIVKTNDQHELFPQKNV